MDRETAISDHFIHVGSVTGLAVAIAAAPFYLALRVVRRARRRRRREDQPPWMRPVPIPTPLAI